MQLPLAPPPDLDPELVEFLQSPVMIIVGTHAAGRPEIGRALGASVDVAQKHVTLAISAWQWPETVANLRANQRVAATFSRPRDYATYQLKGRAIGIHPASGPQRAAASRYSRLIANDLAALGVEPVVSAPWRVDRDLMAVTLSVEAAFLQTPGSDAGRPIGPAGSVDRS